MQVVSAEQAWGNRFLFTPEGDLTVAEGVLSGPYPRILEPAEIPGSDDRLHQVQRGDQLVAAVGEGRDRQFKVVPLRYAGLLLTTAPRLERGVITSDNELIDLSGHAELTVRFVDKLIANALITTPKEAEQVAGRVGQGHQFLSQFKNYGVVKAYIEHCYPNFVPREEPARRQFAEAA